MKVGQKKKKKKVSYHPELDFTRLLAFIPEQLSHRWENKERRDEEMVKIKMETAA